MADGATGRRMKLGTMPSLKEDSLNGGTPRYRDIQAMAQTAEAVGFDSFWLADHVVFRAPEGENVGCWEVFTFLSALAAATTTHRARPARRLHVVPQPGAAGENGGQPGRDQRWAVHPRPRQRLERAGIHDVRLALRSPRRSLRGGDGDHRALTARGEAWISTASITMLADAVLAPRGPSPKGPPLMIGGTRPRMLRLTAQYADAYNTDTVFSAARVTELWEGMRAACAAVGRDPATLELTSFTSVRVLGHGESAQPNEQAIVGTAEEVARSTRKSSRTQASRISSFASSNSALPVSRHSHR